MSEKVKIINAIDWWTLNLDTDFSQALIWLTHNWVKEWLVPTQAGWAGTDIEVPAWIALIKTTRTSVVPTEDILMVFRNTVAKTLTVWNSKKIFIEITQDNINDATQNTNVNWTWIWSIKIDDAYPAWNFIKLWETDWAWLLATTVLENLRIDEAILNYTDLTALTWNIVTTWDISWANWTFSWDVDANAFTWDWSGLTNIDLTIPDATETVRWLIRKATLEEVQKNFNNNEFIWIQDLFSLFNLAIVPWTDFLISQLNTQQNHSDGTSNWVKVKEFEADFWWNIYAELEALNTNNTTAVDNWVRIYINWTYVWTWLSWGNISSSFQLFTHSNITISQWDLVQVYVTNQGATNTTSIKNFRLKNNVQLNPDLYNWWTINLN